MGNFTWYLVTCLVYSLSFKVKCLDASNARPPPPPPPPTAIATTAATTAQ
jgi:hypothetical protein